MGNEIKSKFTKKISPLIEGQVPDFVQADHPTFVDFVRDYFKFVEAGKLSVSGNIDYIILETATTSYIIDERDGDRIVTEAASGSGAKFINGETITGATTGATATVLVEDSRNSQLFTTGQQLFQTGETVTGSTSGAEATVTEYRGNPIQNIQQMLEYADVDNTLFDFLDQMRDSFMTAIPETLASGVSKRNLIKNIKDLYSAKGSSEGHKLFMRLLLGENAEIFYPTEYMLRLSNGNWRRRTIMRVQAFSGVSGSEVINQVITGATSGATAVVLDSLVTQQGSNSVTELRLANITGAFVDGEIISANSSTRDISVSFTIEGIVASTSVTNDGILYTDLEEIELENIGNGFAEIIVDGISEGSVSEVIVDDVGTGYEVGDALTFTANTVDTNVDAASGFVSMIGGGIQLETATLDDSSLTDDAIILETGTTSQLESFNIQLETNVTDRFRGDGETTAFTLTETNANNDTIKVNLDNVVTPSTNAAGETVWTASGTTLTFDGDFTPANGVDIFVYASRNDLLILDRTSAGGNDIGHNLITDSVEEFEDAFTTGTDQIVLEFDTFENLSVSNESGSIQKVFVSNGGGQGYTKLPTVSVTSTSGQNAVLSATTENIGAVKSIKINDSGFNYIGTNPPDATFRAHFVLKDVSGTFANGNTLTSHTGTVKGYDSNTRVLDTTFENVVRVEQEQTSTFNEGIELEEGTQVNASSSILLEDVLDFDDGENIVLDGTETFTPAAQTITKKVRVGRNATDTANIFYIDDEPAPRLVLYEGNTYYFDLSDSSLYNAVSTKNHQLRFSETENGTHGGGVAYTTGVTTSASTIAIGTAGAYIQIVVASGAPPLFYYCVNHSGMGNSIQTTQYETIVLNSGSNILFDATQHGPNVATIKLEAGTQGRKDTDNIIFEDNGRPILLEESIIGTLQDVEDKLLIDRYQEENTGNFFIDLETETAGTFGGRLATEDFGNRLVLDGTDASSTDARDRIVFADETGDGQIILDGTDSDSTDAGGHIINESGIDFSNRNVTITDSSGATGTIVTADIATGTTAVDVISTDAGSYDNINSLLGQDLIRIQDSYYYQDYSYEVQVGESFTTYVDELKKAVHPAGFQPFGRVTIATLVSAAITNTAAGVSDYDGDTKTFSPILASVLETLFDQHLKMRLGVATSTTNDGQTSLSNRDDQIIQEDGTLPGGNIVLDGTSPDPAGTSNSGLGAFRGGLGTIENPRHIVLDGSGDFTTAFSIGGPFIDGVAQASTTHQVFRMGHNGFSVNEIKVGMIVTTGDGASTPEGLTAGNQFTDADGNNAVSRDRTVTVTAVGDVFNVGDGGLQGLPQNQIFTSSEPLIMGQLVDLVFKENEGGNVLFEDGDLVTSETHLVPSRTWNVRHLFNFHGFASGVDDDGFVFGVGHNSAVHPTPSLSDQVAITVNDPSDLRITDSDGHNAISTDGSLKLSSYTEIFSPAGLTFSLLTSNDNFPDDGTGFSTNNVGLGRAARHSTIDLFNLIITLSEPIVISGGDLVIRSLMNTGERIIAEGDYNLILNGTDASSTDAGDHLVLDGTDDSSTDAGDQITLEDGVIDVFVMEDGFNSVGDAILFEANTKMVSDDITAGTDTGGGRMMAETSHAPSDKFEKALVTEKTVKVSKQPVYLERNLLLHLAELPFGTRNKGCGITLESGSGTLADSLILDGQLPFDEGDAFIVLDATAVTISSSGNIGVVALFGEGDNILLNGTDTDSSNAGDKLLAESDFFAFPVGFKVDENDRFLLDSDHNDQTITLSDVGSLTFAEIRRADRLQINDSNDSFHYGGSEEDSILTEASENIIMEDFSTNSNQAKLLLNLGEEVILEDTLNPEFFGNIKLENEDGAIILNATDPSSISSSNATDFVNFAIVLDGTDADGTDAGDHLLLDGTNIGGLPESFFPSVDLTITESVFTRPEKGVFDDGDKILTDQGFFDADAGDFLNLEEFHSSREDANLLLETHNVFPSRGHIPLSNFSINSSNKVTAGIVQSAEVVVRSTGEVALEDATLGTGATDDTATSDTYYLLDETNGNNMDLEGGTSML